MKPGGGAGPAGASTELATLGRLAALGKVASSLAHEINNPLAIILENAGWLQDLLAEEDVAASPNLREFAATVDKIILHAGRARDIAHRLLGFSRQKEPERIPVRVAALLEQTVGFLESEARLRNITIRRPVADATACTDPSRLQQVVLNLLDNAIDALGKDGTITLDVQAGPDAVAIVVADDGPGMPPEVQARVFEPFFTTKPAGLGTGLGLALSREMVQQMGGSLDMESRPGRTVFRIRLPVANPC